MKKTLFLIVVFLNTLLATEINEYKVDLYYANGIMLQDSAEQAEDKWRIRVKNLLQKYPQLQTKIGKTDVAYNISHGIVEDLWESFNQKVDLEPSWNAGWEGFKEVIDRIPLTKAVGYLIKAAEIANEYISGNTLDEQVTKYKESIESGHGVVVVAHSQGNLFTSQAYNRLVGESKDGWMGKFFIRLQ